MNFGSVVVNRLHLLVFRQRIASSSFRHFSRMADDRPRATRARTTRRTKLVVIAYEDEAAPTAAADSTSSVAPSTGRPIKRLPLENYKKVTNWIVSTGSGINASGKSILQASQSSTTEESKQENAAVFGGSEAEVEIETAASPLLSAAVANKKAKWIPPDWEKTLQHIQTMRINRDAPVDTMGCERTMEENVEPKVRRYQTLVSLMLSSQTKDQVTFEAMNRLKAHGLTVQNILDTDEATLGKIITPVGFWKKKADYIKRATQILRDKYDDDIPDTIEGLCSLPGVGQKMGYIALNVAFGKNAGIGVDTHVHRISNRLKWAGEVDTKTPEKTRLALEGWLPESLWQDVNILLVGFGQTVCLPVNPKCSTCLVRELCPYGTANLLSGGKKKNKKNT